MPQKKSAKRRTQSRKIKGKEVAIEAARALRTLNDREAFHFYEDVGRPIGMSARNLNDFLQKTESVKVGSLVFHLQRKDFQNWIKDTLGDTELATKLGRIRVPNDDDLRAKIHSTVENRIKELQKTCTGLTISES
jgi:hypothetical protein